MRFLMCLCWFVMSDVLLARGPFDPACSLSGASGKQSENLLSALTQVPTPPFAILEKNGPVQFMATSNLYAEVLNISDKSIILNDLEELRFLTQTLAHSSILLVLPGKGEWSEEKAKKVLSVAKLLDIKISLLWLGEKSGPKPLRDMITATGGQNFGTNDLLKRVEKLCVAPMA